MKKDLLTELENIKVDNSEIVSTIQNMQETLLQLIVDTNKLTFKLQDLEKEIEMIED